MQAATLFGGLGRSYLIPLTGRPNNYYCYRFAVAYIESEDNDNRPERSSHMTFLSLDGGQHNAGLFCFLLRKQKLNAGPLPRQTCRFPSCEHYPRI